MELSLPNTAGSRLRSTLQLGGGSQTRVAPPNPTLARSLQHVRRCTASLWKQRVGRDSQEDPQAALLCKGKMKKGTPEKNGWTEGETLHTVPLSLRQEGGAAWPAAGGEKGACAEPELGGARGVGFREKFHC